MTDDLKNRAEEAAEKYAKKFDGHCYDCADGFLAGAEWRDAQPSAVPKEEEVDKLALLMNVGHLALGALCAYAGTKDSTVIAVATLLLKAGSNSSYVREIAGPQGLEGKESL